MGADELGTVYGEVVPSRWPDNDPDCDRAIAGKMENGTSLVFHDKDTRLGCTAWLVAS